MCLMPEALIHTRKSISLFSVKLGINVEPKSSFYLQCVDQKAKKDFQKAVFV